MNLEAMSPDLAKMIRSGALGFFSHFEVTEVFAQKDKKSPVINVLTVVVLEERIDDNAFEPSFLNLDRIKIASLKGWVFGICRYSKPIDQLTPALERLSDDSLWQESGKALQMGSLVPSSPMFVPPDASTLSPLNRVLKKNFWNGSYVFEWFDKEKTNLSPLLSGRLVSN